MIAEPAPQSDQHNKQQITFDQGSFSPIPLEHHQSPEKVLLGNMLFHDPRLSADDTVSCSSCHILALGGDDGRAVSVGVNGQQGELNAPTVFNSRFNFSQFWDGRAASLEEQISGPLKNPVEMATNWPDVLRKLKADKPFVQLFAKTYPQGITIDTVVDAIATFERSLITPDSDFDRYLRGDKQAMSESAIEGMHRFQEFGCVACHQGVNLGGNMYQKFGVFETSFGPDQWLGRFHVTGWEEDRYVFKVPGLRNVALTAPYFHDGGVDQLADAVKLMAKKQLGRNLPDEDVDYLVSFLNSLTGEWQGRKLDEL